MQRSSIPEVLGHVCQGPVLVCGHSSHQAWLVATLLPNGASAAVSVVAQGKPVAPGKVWIYYTFSSCLLLSCCSSRRPLQQGPWIIYQSPQMTSVWTCARRASTSRGPTVNAPTRPKQLSFLFGREAESVQRASTLVLPLKTCGSLQPVVRPVWRLHDRCADLQQARCVLSLPRASDAARRSQSMSATAGWWRTTRLSCTRT